MKILVITQTVDSQNTTLGFFEGWLKKISLEFDFMHVICLYEGQHNLQDNVSVHSLGKESHPSKFSYILKFYSYIWRYRHHYDVVFVHMNQEYVVLGGLFWKILGKDVFLWRNHPHGDIWTKIAVFFSKKVFCTSPLSFTARYKKTVLMPVGVDTEIFKPTENSQRNKNTICIVGRISPIKNIHIGLSAIKYLIDSGAQVSLTIVGSHLPKDERYHLSLQKFIEKNNLGSFVKFLKAVPSELLPEIYSSHEICLNLTEGGSFDKTIVEATACGAIPLVTNQSLVGFLPSVCVTQSDIKSIAHSLGVLLRYDTKDKIEQELKDFAEQNSLKNLMKKLGKEITNK